MRSILRLLPAMLLCGAHPATADIRLEAETVYYTGPIAAIQNQELFGLVSGRAVNRLMITSAGGEVEAGIALGLWIHESGIDVEVPEYCLSSCANYVFPAGKHKTIHPGAVVAWHGNYNHLVRTGLWQDDIAGRMERLGEDDATARQHVRTQAERLAHLERDFFERIGVDEYLCWIGKQPPYKVTNYYFLSARDMARFGVTKVRTPPDYAGTDVSGFDSHLVYIELKNQ
ncbi:MAG: hypothetical protein WBQ78_08215 [Gammaproteobacteria bacterium]